MSDAYLGHPHAKIVGTLTLLRHFQAFLRSTCREMHDPIGGWGHSLTQPQARHKLTFLINMAINRKAGLPDAPSRKYDPDYQRGLLQDANDLNYPRLRIYFIRTPELRRRFAHRLVTADT
jgi:hypothetical protein